MTNERSAVTNSCLHDTLTPDTNTEKQKEIARSGELNAKQIMALSEADCGESCTWTPAPDGEEGGVVTHLCFVYLRIATQSGGLFVPRSGQRNAP